MHRPPATDPKKGRRANSRVRIADEAQICRKGRGVGGHAAAWSWVFVRLASSTSWRFRLFHGRVCLEAPARDRLELKLPQRRHALVFPARHARLPQPESPRYLALRTKVIDQLLERHGASIAGAMDFATPAHSGIYHDPRQDAGMGGVSVHRIRNPQSLRRSIQEPRPKDRLGAEHGRPERSDPASRANDCGVLMMFNPQALPGAPDAEELVCLSETGGSMCSERRTRIA